MEALLTTERRRCSTSLPAGRIGQRMRATRATVPVTIRRGGPGAIRAFPVSPHRPSVMR